MREIKYRAWDKTKELLVNAELILGIRFDRRHQKPTLITYTRKKMNPTMEISHLDKIYCNEFELMQFTGLRDKNGKEIYEGDVVVAMSEGYKGTFEIRWRQEGSPSWILFPAWQDRDLWSLHGMKQRDGSYYDSVEVIGNIYENPELLEVD